MSDSANAALFLGGALLVACGGGAFEVGGAGGAGGSAGATVMSVGGATANGAGNSATGGSATAGATERGGKEGGGGESNLAGDSGEPGHAGAGGDSPPVGTACVLGGWSASASLGVTPQYAIDGMPTTRWTTDVPREPGQWFELDFGESLGVLYLALHTELYPLDSPALVEVSLDGAPAAFTPTAPAPGVLALELEGKAARKVRVTASDSGKPVPQFMNQPAWWSIYEVEATCVTK